MQFTYKATRKDGTNVNGAIEAADHTAALSALTRQGLHPLVVKAGSGKTGGSVPVAGGIVLSCEGMRAVKEIEGERNPGSGHSDDASTA